MSTYLSGREYWDGVVTLSARAQEQYRVTDIVSPYDAHAVEVTFFVGCDNDEAAVEETLTLIIDAMHSLGKSYEIVLIDDASKDRTAQLARDFIGRHPEISMLLKVNKRRKGLAANYIDAAFIGRGKYFRMVRHNAESMETLADIFKSLGEADIILPYYLEGLRGHRQRPFWHKVYTQMLNLLAWEHINDYRGQPVHLRYNVMRWHSNAQGAGFQDELLCRLLDMGFTFKQVPTRRDERQQEDRLRWRDLFSLAHTLVVVTLRRLSRLVHRR